MSDDWDLYLDILHYLAVVDWHREAGSEELHNPCAQFRETTALAGYIDILGEASRKAGWCCLLAIAITQTLQEYCSRSTQSTHT